MHKIEIEIAIRMEIKSCISKLKIQLNSKYIKQIEINATQKIKC